ncbi:aegerolysin type hemolysin [Lactifluus subvellereus]|nr:aegerolysin type hemolysin [Lactifluus subvellereus]
MGEAQWFQPTVRNRLFQAIVLANFSIQYGKFYDIKNPYNETVSAQGTKIQSKDQHEWGHCGREASPTGTEGSFEVRLEESNEKIAEIYWDCPFVGDNKLEKRYVQEGYDISFDGFSIPSSALGKGTINVRED